MASGDRPNTSRKRKPKGAGKESDKPQSERFKETARTLEADESGQKFKGLLEKILPVRADGDKPIE